MKAILIPCICIVLLYAVSSAKDLQLDYRLKLHLWYMQDLRNDIQEKINNLYSQSTSTELSTKFSQIVAQYTVFGGLDSKISRALKETLEQVDSVTEKTKKVQHCYDEEYKAFEDLINGVLSAYYQCVNVGFAQLQAPVPHLEECAEQGKKIIQKLKNLMSICWPVHSPAPKESCIIENVKCTNPLVQMFWTNYKTIYQSSTKKLKQVSKNFDNCYKRQMGPLHKKVEEIRAAASKCVQGL